MSQPGPLRLPRAASLLGGLFWLCVAPALVYADNALDKPGTTVQFLDVKVAYPIFTQASRR
jgi:hypothetical protein